MLTNASRQATLVVSVLIISILLLATWSQPVGIDLKGGTALTYRVDFQTEIAKGNLPASADKGQVMNRTIRTIRQRIDPGGQLGIGVQRRGADGMLVELPEMTEEAAALIQERIETLGKLEMRIVADGSYSKNDVSFEIPDEKKRLTDWLDKDENRALVAEDPSKILLFNTLPTEDGGSKSPRLRWFPRKIGPSVDNRSRWEGAYGLGNPQSKYVPVYTAADYNGGLIPEALVGQEQEPFLVEFLPINMDERAFTGSDLQPGSVVASSYNGKPCLLYAIRGALRTEYYEWSGEYKGQQSAILLNDVVETAPVFEGAIPGNGQISGSFTAKEVKQLEEILSSGALRVQPFLESRYEIGPSLGQASIRLGTMSIVGGGILVLVFILWYYQLAGLVAFGAICLNILTLLAGMRFLQATLTLPGLAGLVLTVGMAVDANILIYERIREEIDRGKELLQAVRAGFSRAMGAILDANITTFIAGVVLFNVGVGPVRGFAVTLMVGIVTTLFTAFFVSRLFFHYMLENNVLKNFNVKNLFGSFSFDFVAHTRRAMTVSAVVIVVGLAFTMLVVPSDHTLGLDFTGGANLRVVTKEAVTQETIAKALQNDEGFGAEYTADVNPVASKGNVSDQFSIKIKLTNAKRAELEQAQKDARANNETYEAEYLKLVRNALADRLVADAYSNPSVLPKESGGTAFATIELHFSKAVKLADVQSRLIGSIGTEQTVEVRPLEAGEAATTKDLIVDWDVPAGTDATELFDIVGPPLAELPGADGSVVKLSNPIPENAIIQGQIVGELRNAAIAALVIALGVIVFFMGWRFHEYSYGWAAVAAVVHDILVTMVVVVTLNYTPFITAEIDLPMIAAFLTIIGYSINDTIVIFDRVRENSQESARLGEQVTFASILNRSINQTLSRTILTSCTTLFVVLTQFVVNYGANSALEGFSFALIVGLISGTYSTIFIATPVVLWLRGGKLPEESASTEPTAVPAA